MLRFLLASRVERAIVRAARGPFVPPLAGVLAFALTATMTVPVTAVIVPAVLVARHRAKWIVLLAALGSALGATLLFAVFHHWGWDQVYAVFPEMQQSKAWLGVIDWVDRWGVPALFAVAALPLPQTPALIVLALGPHATATVLIAILAGKLVKYGVVAAAVAAFPERFGPPAGGGTAKHR
jgi:membrane protein YqaA with SNARE-associated domain